VKKTVREVPELNIERHPLTLILSAVMAFLLVATTYQLFKEMNPWGFLLMVPSAFVLFHTLWTLLNPFALVFADRIEMKQSLFSNRQYFFNDVKRLHDANGKLFVVFRDDDSERLSLFGIKGSARELLKKVFADKVRNR
jgi:hypothetical protein